jgi:hypothetical protein
VVPALAETNKMDLTDIVAALEKGKLPFTGAAHAEEGRPTMELPHGAMPEVAPAADPATTLPLETYASVCAALAHGEPRREALPRHGLSGEAFDTFAKAWAQRFQREPHLVATFKDLVSAASARRGA